MIHQLGTDGEENFPLLFFLPLILSPLFACRKLSRPPPPAPLPTGFGGGGGGGGLGGAIFSPSLECHPVLAVAQAHPYLPSSVFYGIIVSGREGRG